MSDLVGNITRLLQGSEVLHIRPGSTVQIYDAGTDDQVWAGTADANGMYTVPTLDTGHYDIRVDGVHQKSVHHVKADHVHTPDEPFTWFISGAITGSQDEVDTLPVFAPGLAGDIIKIEITARTTAAGDVTVHLLRGATAGSAALTVASDSVWQKQIDPGAIKYRWAYPDNNPGLSLTAAQALTIGIAHTADGVSGVTVRVYFRPS